MRVRAGWPVVARGAVIGRVATGAGVWLRLVVPAVGHALFHADSRHVLGEIARPGRDLRRELPVVPACRLLRAARQEWYEQGDCWARLPELAWQVGEVVRTVMDEPRPRLVEPALSGERSERANSRHADNLLISYDLWAKLIDERLYATITDGFGDGSSCRA